ncbi:MAG: hypothetical protein NTX12_01730 [Actinobacteria bacterium]|nr:hypothetical protein [Actinomycetota bacterium]
MPIISLGASRLALTRLGYLAVTVGAGFGIFGWVKAGAIVISIGAAGVSFGRDARGRVERFMPLALALTLLGLAIALP